MARSRRAARILPSCSHFALARAREPPPFFERSRPRRRRGLFSSLSGLLRTTQVFRVVVERTHGSNQVSRTAPIHKSPTLS